MFAADFWHNAMCAYIFHIHACMLYICILVTMVCMHVSFKKKYLSKKHVVSRHIFGARYFRHSVYGYLLCIYILGAMACMRVIFMSWEHVYDKKMCVTCMYGVATISRMLKNICLFAEYRSLLYRSFAKKTYVLKHPAHRSHPIVWNKWRGCLLYALDVMWCMM